MRPWTRVPAQRALPDPACSLTRLLRPCAPPAPTHPPLAGSRHIPRLPFVVHALASHLPFLCRLPGGAGVRVFVRCKRQGRLARAALRRRSRSAAVPPRRRPLPARHPCSTPARHPSAQAVATYTRAIKDLDDGKLPSWTGMPAPDIGKKYWRLQPDANMRDLLLAIRADEVGWRWGGWVGEWVEGGWPQICNVLVPEACGSATTPARRWARHVTHPAFPPRPATCTSTTPSPHCPATPPTPLHRAPCTYPEPAAHPRCSLLQRI